MPHKVEPNTFNEQECKEKIKKNVNEENLNEFPEENKTKQQHEAEEELNFNLFRVVAIEVFFDFPHQRKRSEYLFFLGLENNPCNDQVHEETR